MMRAVRKILIQLYYLPSTLSNKFVFKLKGVRYGSGLQTKGMIFVSSNGSIKIGKDVRINSSPTSNPIGGGSKTYFQVLEGGSIDIGTNVGISNSALTSSSKITIGNNVRIGSGVCIFDTDFHSINPFQRNYRRYGEREIINSKPVNISNNVFIGTQSIILKGVSIGKNSVIGAGSVVSKDIPENQVWAGNPAKFVRKLRDDELESNFVKVSV